MFALEIISGGPNRLAILVKLGALNSATFAQSQYYRFAIAPFLHVSLIHLASNMIALLFVGSILERGYGHLRFLLVYSISALVSSFLSVIMIPNGVVIVGASGAVVGCFVALLILQLRYRNTISAFGPNTTLCLIACIILSGFIPSSGIDNATHFGGIIAGSAVGILVSPPTSFFSRIQDADPVLRRMLTKRVNSTMHYGWTSVGRVITIALVLTAVFGTVSSTLYPRLQVSAVNVSIESSRLDGSITMQVAGNGLFAPEAAMVTLGEVPLIVQI